MFYSMSQNKTTFKADKVIDSHRQLVTEKCYRPNINRPNFDNYMYMCNSLIFLMGLGRVIYSLVKPNLYIGR